MECLIVFTALFALTNTIILVSFVIWLKDILETIMATQAEFDAQLARMNTKLDALGTQISDEAQQIRDFIEANPDLDTTGLEAVVSRLDAIDVSGIFEPPTPPEPTPEPEPEV